jgi:1-acyl-sn-glycerol-3-phosphate acyltransferase
VSANSRADWELILPSSWAKNTLFKNKLAGAILRDAGNIPVDRKNKDNQSLFAGTFDVLKLGEAVAIFPEGTSYTEPGIRAIKDGAAWVRPYDTLIDSR